LFVAMCVACVSRPVQAPVPPPEPNPDTAMLDTAFPRLAAVLGSDLRSRDDLVPAATRVPDDPESASAKLLEYDWRHGTWTWTWTWLDLGREGATISKLEIRQFDGATAWQRRPDEAEVREVWGSFAALASVDRHPIVRARTFGEGGGSNGSAHAPQRSLLLRWSNAGSSGGRAAANVGRYTTDRGLRDWREVVDEAAWTVFSTARVRTDDAPTDAVAKHLLDDLAGACDSMSVASLERDSYAIRQAIKCVAELQLKDPDGVLHRLRQRAEAVGGPDAADIVAHLNVAGR
jgi:hypothetical protein